MATKEYCFFLPAVILILTASAFAGWCPSADLNTDCWVNIYDLQILAEQWLDTEACEEAEKCADFDGLNSINFVDFAFLASQWQTHSSLLFINEFMASNNSASGIRDPLGDSDDWLEIYNLGAIPVDMAGMYLTDNLSNPIKYHIPTGDSLQTTIPAGGFLVFWTDDETAEGPLHTNFKLSADGEEIGLFDTDGVTQIDTVVFGVQAANISYGRYPDAGETWQFFPIATPGAPNHSNYTGDTEKVEFSKERGFYDTSFSLALACTTPDVNIYYTTDGRAPIAGEAITPTSIRYTSPIEVTGTTYIRAAAIKTGWRPSPIETHTYIFGASSAIKAMPAVSLVGDPTQTFYEPNGIMAIVGGYYDGDGVWVDTDGSGTAVYNNVIHRGIAYERPVSFEIIDRPADSNYQTDCGIRIHASDYTRPRFTRGEDWLCNKNKISFNLFFRSDYGDNRFDYLFFPLTPEVQHPQSIVLRSGMNDRCSPFIKDEWMRRLFKDMGGIQETGSFANLYINGSYKYYYNPTGRADEQFYQEWYDTENEFDVITQGGVRDGDEVAFNNLLSYISSHDLANAADYNYFDSQFDIQSFIDYLILQIYSANFDWPNNNFTVHRERSAAGKFRYSVWDAEGIEKWVIDDPQFGMDVNAFDDMPTYGSTPKGLNGGDWAIPRFYRALKANPNFRQLWADRTHKWFHNNGVLSQDYLLARWYEALGEVEAVLPPPPWDFDFIPNSLIPNREPYVLLAFEDNGLFDRAFGAPVFNVNGLYKFGGYVTTSDIFTIIDPCASGGVIYYTIDGSDPRLPLSREPKTFAPETASKKVLVPTGDIGTAWRGGSEPYDDSSWTSGTGGVGFERDAGYDPYIGIDVESAMYGVNGTCYIRIPFTVNADDIDNVTALTLKMRYDDGFVVYINGIEVKRNYAPTTPVWNSKASTSSPEATSAWNSYDISAYINTIHEGNNILAIHGLNASTTSSDFLICTELVSNVITGGTPSAAIQYTDPFNLDKSTNLRARIYKNSNQTWSPINEAVYEVGNVKNAMRITEIMYHPLDTSDPNDPNTEYIELKNIGTDVINLNLVKFDKGIKFTFGPDTLTPDEHILVVKNKSAFEAKYGTERYIAGEYSGSLDNAGERLRLLDAVGTTILDFNYTDGWHPITDGDGYSLTVINPADSNVNHWGRKDSWRASAYVNGSPGWDDSGIVPNPGEVVINEIMAHSDTNWVELRNTTASAIDISGWYLSDSNSNVMKYRFAAGTSIAANGYLVVYENSNFGPNSSDPGRLIPFALSENGNTVCLTSALDAYSKLTGYRETEDIGASETGVSFGRYYKASTNSYDFVPMDYDTLGYANAYPKIGPIVITEIMYHPDWPTTGSYANDEYEYIELHNTSDTAVTLYDSVENLPWKFTNGIDYTFASPPGAITIAAGAKILVVRNVEAFRARYPSVPTGIIFGPYSDWLANDSEQLELSKPGNVDELGVRHYIRIERVDYSDGRHPNGEPGDVDLWPTGADGLGNSLTRTSTTQYGNDPSNWTAATPTPGS